MIVQTLMYPCSGSAATLRTCGSRLTLLTYWAIAEFFKPADSLVSSVVAISLSTHEPSLPQSIAGQPVRPDQQPIIGVGKMPYRHPVRSSINAS